MNSEKSAAYATLQPLAVPVKQACSMVGIGLTKIYELIDKGEVVSYLDGARRMITVESLRDRTAKMIAEGQGKREVKSRRQRVAAA